MVVQPMNNAKAEDKKSVDSREKKRKIRDQSPVIFPHILHLIGVLFFSTPRFSVHSKSVESIGASIICHSYAS